MRKYTITTVVTNSNYRAGKLGDKVILSSNGKPIATFEGDYPNDHTNAQKVCDLLNEVSRSQGKHS